MHDERRLGVVVFINLELNEVLVRGIVSVFELALDDKFEGVGVTHF